MFFVPICQPRSIPLWMVPEPAPYQYPVRSLYKRCAFVLLRQMSSSSSPCAVDVQAGTGKNWETRGACCSLFQGLKNRGLQDRYSV